MSLKQKILVAIMGAGLTLAGAGAVTAAPLYHHSHRIERVAHHQHRQTSHRHASAHRASSGRRA